MRKKSETKSARYTTQRKGSDVIAQGLLSTNRYTPAKPSEGRSILATCCSKSSGARKSVIGLMDPVVDTKVSDQYRDDRSTRSKGSWCGQWKGESDIEYVPPSASYHQHLRAKSEVPKSYAGGTTPTRDSSVKMYSSGNNGSANYGTRYSATTVKAPHPITNSHNVYRSNVTTSPRLIGNSRVISSKQGVPREMLPSRRDLSSSYYDGCTVGVTPPSPRDYVSGSNVSTPRKSASDNKLPSVLDYTTNTSAPTIATGVSSNNYGSIKYSPSRLPGPTEASHVRRTKVGPPSAPLLSVKSPQLRHAPYTTNYEYGGNSPLESRHHRSCTPHETGRTTVHYGQPVTRYSTRTLPLKEYEEYVAKHIRSKSASGNIQLRIPDGYVNNEKIQEYIRYSQAGDQRETAPLGMSPVPQINFNKYENPHTSSPPRCSSFKGMRLDSKVVDDVAANHRMHPNQRGSYTDRGHYAYSEPQTDQPIAGTRRVVYLLNEPLNALKRGDHNSTTTTHVPPINPKISNQSNNLAVDRVPQMSPATDFEGTKPLSSRAEAVDTYRQPQYRGRYMSGNSENFVSSINPADEIENISHVQAASKPTVFGNSQLLADGKENLNRTSFDGDEMRHQSETRVASNPRTTNSMSSIEDDASNMESVSSRVAEVIDKVMEETGGLIDPPITTTKAERTLSDGGEKNTKIPSIEQSTSSRISKYKNTNITLRDVGVQNDLALDIGKPGIANRGKLLPKVHQSSNSSSDLDGSNIVNSSNSSGSGKHKSTDLKKEPEEETNKLVMLSSEGGSSDTYDQEEIVSVTRATPSEAEIQSTSTTKKSKARGKVKKGVITCDNCVGNETLLDSYLTLREENTFLRLKNKLLEESQKFIEEQNRFFHNRNGILEQEVYKHSSERFQLLNTEYRLLQERNLDAERKLHEHNYENQEPIDTSRDVTVHREVDGTSYYDFGDN